jgi:hypothetical protein
MKVAGVLKGREDTAAFSSVAFGLRGKSDGIYQLPGWKKPRLFELKTIKTSNFTPILKTRMPEVSHIVQANGYMAMHKFDMATIVYECKDDHRIIECNLPFSPELWDMTVVTRMAEIEAHMADGTVPERESAVINKRGEPEPGKFCRWCDYQHWCFCPSKEIEAEAKRLLKGGK